MKALAAVLPLAMLALGAAFAAADSPSVASELQTTLEQLRVVPPDKSIPENIAAFSGVWYGEWRGQRTSAHMADQLVAVEEIISPTSARVVYAGVGRYGDAYYSNRGRTWNWKVNADFADGKLKFALPSSPRVDVVAEINRQGRMEITGTLSAQAWVGTFSKVREAIAGPR